jgi:hypothetical protein
LGDAYPGEPAESQAKHELRCTRENADAARACAKLHEECGKALKP